MAKKVRLSLIVSQEVVKFMEEFADSEGCTQTEVIRRGLAVMKAYKQQAALGRIHIGFVSDASKLDAEIIGIIT